MGQAKRRGTLEERVKQAKKRLEELKVLSFKEILNYPKQKGSELLPLFRPDYGIFCSKNKKTITKIDSATFINELIKSSMIPTRYLELTIEIIQNKAPYCATFYFDDKTWLKLCRTIKNGFKELVLHHTTNKKQESSKNGEKFKLLRIVDVQGSGNCNPNFRIMGSWGSTTMFDAGRNAYRYWIDNPNTHLNNNFFDSETQIYN